MISNKFIDNGLLISNPAVETNFCAKHEASLNNAGLNHEPTLT